MYRVCLCNHGSALGGIIESTQSSDSLGLRSESLDLETECKWEDGQCWWTNDGDD